jgi:hypothetical protein
MWSLRVDSTEGFTMPSRTRPSRIAEWAELVGDSVPENVDESETTPANRPRDDSS